MAVKRTVLMEIGAKASGSLRATWNAVGQGLSSIRAGAAGLVNSFLSLKSLILGAIVYKAFGALKSAIGSVISAYSEAEAEEKKLQAVLRATGYAAGFTTKQLKEQAAEVQRLTGIDDDLIVSQQAILATFKNVSGDVFKDAILSANDLATVMGTDAKGGIVQLGKVLNDPLKGLTMLTRVGVSFTEEQTKQIEKYVEQGELVKAQRVILDELQGEFGGAAAAMGTTLRGQAMGLSAAWGDAKEELGGLLVNNSVLADILGAVKAKVIAVKDALIEYGPIIKANINAALATAVNWLKGIYEATQQWVNNGGLLATWLKVKATLITLRGIGTMVAGGWDAMKTSVQKVLGWALKLVEAMRIFNPVVNYAAKSFEKAMGTSIKGMAEALDKQSQQSLTDLVNNTVKAQADIDEGAKLWAQSDRPNEMKKRWTDVLNAIKEENARLAAELAKGEEEKVPALTKQLNLAKQLTEEEKKQLAAMAQQYGLMSSLERAQVKSLATRLKTGGLGEFEKLTKEERELIGKSDILKTITEKRGFGQALLEKEMGAGLGQEIKQLVDVKASLTNTIEAKLSVDSESLAQQFTDKVLPILQTMVGQVSETFTQRLLDSRTRARSAELAGAQ